MAKYIKSYSNYVLKEKHQQIDRGTIFERDITTIGGLNQFAKGQTPIYKSSNFIITVNDEIKGSKTVKKQNWEQNGENGVLWTLENTELTSETNPTTKIQLNRDYYKLKDFAYYGSCVELIRSTITDIISNFPGEIRLAKDANGSCLNVYYDMYVDGNVKEPDREILGGENYVLLDNPFGINAHMYYVNEDDMDNTLRYFSNGGFRNYQISITDDDSLVDVTSFTIEKVNENPCVGEEACKVTINGNITFSVFKSSTNGFTYLTDTYTNEFILRPKAEFLEKFFDSLSVFESALLNRDSTPKYTNKFEIIYESNFGYETKIDTFSFPLTYGGYNLATNGIALDSYINSLSYTASLYDELFSDNLYRMMTHESIKNFDWSYTRTYNSGDEEEYVVGGTKIEKLIRLFGREFDEIKSYIDGIKYANTISYGVSNSMPNYFLTDSLEIEGWDVVNIYPFDATNGFSFDDKEYHVGLQQACKTFNYQVVPYSNTYMYYGSNTDERYNGYYFMPTSCSDNVKGLNIELKRGLDLTRESVFSYYTYTDSKNFSREKAYVDYEFIAKNVNITSGACELIYDNSVDCEDCGNVFRRIKEYTHEKSYSPSDINDYFMKTLKLNSKSILRKKGTIDGIEELLSLFNLKSKRFINSLDYSSHIHSDFVERYGDDFWDYEITESSTMTRPIIDKYCQKYGMYQMDYYNYCKTITYDTDDFRNGIYHAYQGLPVTYYYLVNGKLEKPSSEFYGNYDRIVYPYFDKKSTIDGDMYYQMFGGWFSKNYYLDDENNIVELENNELYRETLNNIIDVETITDLVKVAQDTVFDKQVYKVTDLSTSYMIIDGNPYIIKSEMYNGNTYKFIEVDVNNGYFEIGDLIVDNTTVHVSNPYLDSGVTIYDTSTFQSYEKLKIYLLPFEENEGLYTCNFIVGTEIDYTTTCLPLVYTQYNTISEFKLFDNGLFGDVFSYEVLEEFAEDGTAISLDLKIKKEEDKDETCKDSEYFVINNTYAVKRFNDKGWKQLSKESIEYIKISSIVNYFKGNNPHSALRYYDKGYEYMTYFDKIFKYSLENWKFEDSLFEDYDDNINIYEEVDKIGFYNLDVDCDKKTYSRIENDPKIHFFGKHIEYSSESSRDLDNKEDLLSLVSNELYSGISNYTYNTFKATDESNGTLLFQEAENSDYKDLNDDIFDSIINLKVVEIKFNIHFETDSNKWLEQLKYYQDVIIPYLEQVIPSATIVNVTYVNNF